MIYRIGTDALIDRLVIWNAYLKRKIHLIACGGTALTLLRVKDSTKDIDLIVPDYAEHKYLIRVLQSIGYKQKTENGWSSGEAFIFDIFKGSNIHTTELIESPLIEGNHTLFKELSWVS